MYFMVGLAVVRDDECGPRSGARISGERTVGWNRQLRLTPLSVRTYFRVKVLTGVRDGARQHPLLYGAG